uniref:B1248C03.5 protein n=2 Tax=Oryza TaxID=4527 RepID=Q7XPC2_ORYSJ|nr:OSJNBa0042N22.19 [Oryza sativa Japonica Group]CAE76046.1 B1248C03.5 [Oryza sativa Japonica Group]
MGSTLGADNFAFPPGQVYYSGSLDFVIDNLGKFSLLDSDPNQSRTRSESNPGKSKMGSREVGVMLQPLESYSSTESNPGKSKIGSREVWIMVQPLESYSSTDIVNSYSLSEGYNNFDTESINSSEYTNDYTPLCPFTHPL